MTRNVNDRMNAPPRLALYLNAGTLDNLPEWSSAPRGETDALYAALREAGFEGIQGGDAASAHRAGLKFAAGGRIDAPGDADELARAARDQGAVAATLHAGIGIEDDDAVDALIGDMLEASDRHDLPLYLETHRATVAQDMWRTVQLARRHPRLRFNADFSHWYTGLEMVYGGFETKLGFLAPVLERVGFMHGRIGNPGSMQVDVGQTLDEALSRPYVGHFVEMWTRAMGGFLRNAEPGDVLVFAPELLSPAYYYARTCRVAGGAPREEGDRWQQALLYCDIARHAFERARG